MSTPPRIFVSHSHWDAAICRRLVQYLRTTLGIPVFYDESELHGGDEWLQRIQHEVVGATAFIVVLSRHSVDAAAVWVRQETNLALSLAIEAEKTGQRRPIIPIRVDPDLAMPAILQFAPLLTLRQIVDFFESMPDDRLADVARVARGEASDQALPAAAPAPAQAQAYVDARDLARQTHAAVERQQWALGMTLGARAVQMPGNADDATLWGDYAQALIGWGEADEGLRALREALRRNPKRTDYWQMQAQLLRSRGDVADASAAWDEAFHTTVATDLRLAILREHLATVRDDPAQQRQVRVLIGLALELAPGDAWWLGQRVALEMAPIQTRYDAALTAQDWSAALDACATALRIVPNDASWQERQRTVTARRSAAAAAEQARLLDDLRQRYDAALAAQNWSAAQGSVTEAQRLVGPADAQWAARQTRIASARDEAERRARDEAERQRRAQLWLGVERAAGIALSERYKDLGFVPALTGAGRAVITPPLATIPAGPFLMGSDNQRDSQARVNEVLHEVTLGAYQIALFPVTVAEWVCALRAGKVKQPPDKSPWGIDIAWKTQLTRLDHPIVNVSWPDAQAYLAWLREATGDNGWRLPTEAEWEKAARWDAATKTARIYPWGDSWDQTKANTLEGGPKTTTPVGTYDERGDASPYGCHDLAGNVWEWTSSLYFDEAYQADNRREDSTNISGSRVLRGGSWRLDSLYARAAYRDMDGPHGHDGGFVGIRLARVPVPGSG